MRYLLTLLLLCPLLTYGQSFLPTGAVTQGTYQRGGYGADSVFGVPVGDTIPRFTGWRNIGRIMVNDNDSQFYYNNGTEWVRLSNSTDIDTSVFQLKSNMVDNIQNVSTTYPNSAAVYDALGEKAPVINEQGGYQVIAWQDDLRPSFSVQEGVLLPTNGDTIVNIFHIDSTGSHTSNNGKIAIRFTTDNMRTWFGQTIGTPYSILYSLDTIDARNIAAGFVNGQLIVCFRGYNSVSATQYGPYWFTADSKGGNKSGLTIMPTTLPTSSPIQPFNKMYKTLDNVWHMNIGGVGYWQVMNWNGSLFSPGVTSPYDTLLNEPVSTVLPSGAVITIARNERKSGPNVSPTIWINRDNLTTPPTKIGFTLFNNNLPINEGAGFIHYDPIRNKIITGWGQRHKCCGMNNPALDSFSIYVADTNSAINNTWSKMAAISRPIFNSNSAANWYPDVYQKSDTIFGYLTDNFNPPTPIDLYEQFFDFKLHWISQHNNGGLNNTYIQSNGLTATPSILYNNIFDFRKIYSTYAPLNKLLVQGDILMYDANIPGFTNYPQDSIKSSSNLANTLSAGQTFTSPSPVYVSGAQINTTTFPATFYQDASVNGAISYKHATISAGTKIDATFEFGSGLTTAQNAGVLKVSFYKNNATSVFATGPIATYYGNKAFPATQIQAGFDASGNLTIKIGSTNTAWGSNVYMILRDVKTSFTGGLATSWYTGWTSSLVTDTTGYSSLVTIPIVSMLTDAANSVTSTQIAANAVTTAKILDGNVTPAKLSFTSTRSSAGTLTVAYGNDYTFTGTTTTWTLPAISASITGRQNAIRVKNAGSGNITLNTNASANVLYTTTLTNTMNILPGEAYTFRPDGTIFAVE